MAPVALKLAFSIVAEVLPAWRDWRREGSTERATLVLLLKLMAALFLLGALLSADPQHEELTSALIGVVAVVTAINVHGLFPGWAVPYVPDSKVAVTIFLDFFAFAARNPATSATYQFCATASTMVFAGLVYLHHKMSPHANAPPNTSGKSP
jgi:hypothetical protein